MVKKGAKKAAKARKKPRNAVVARVMGGLDKAAIQWRNLLLDPCGSDLVPACYAGTGTGVFNRYRTVSNIGGSDVAGVVVFQLGSNTQWSFGSTGVGTNVTFGAGAPIFTIPTLQSGDTSFRCIAGCLKVRYTGSESNRSGTLGLFVGPPVGAPGSAFLSTNATSLMSAFPHVNRTGEVIHEVKWAPNQHDELMDEYGGTGGNGYQTCLVVAYSGVPAGSLQLEITGVFESEYISGGNATVGVVNTVPTPSRNTVNHVLQSLGPATKWAYSQLAAPVIRAAAGYASTMIKSAVNQSTTPLLTYAAML